MDMKRLGEDTYRLRWGDYRVVFHSDRESDLIIVYEIASRGRIGYAKG